MAIRANSTFLSKARQKRLHYVFYCFCYSLLIMQR